MGGVSYAWNKIGKNFYDKLVMDDIIPRLDGLHPTKVLSGKISPYHDSNEVEANRYKQMKRIYYTYKHGILRRKFIVDSQVEQEEIVYIHLQKRKMVVNLKDDTTSFDIIDNSFCPYKVYNYAEHMKNIKGNSIYNRLQYVKIHLVNLKYKLISS